MSSINQVQQDLLGRMQQLASVAEGQPIRPSSMAANAISGSFEAALRSVDAERQERRSGRRDDRQPEGQRVVLGAATGAQQTDHGVRRRHANAALIGPES